MPPSLSSSTADELALPVCPAAAIRDDHAIVRRFEAIYDEHFAFVFRSMRRLGVPEHALDDGVQEVFLIAYRKLGEFEGWGSVQSWLFGITRRVAHDYRRTVQRRDPRARSAGDVSDPDTLADTQQPDPQQAAERAALARVLHEVLAELKPDYREVLILADYEEMAAPEIAEALAVNTSVVHARLRVARKHFNQAMGRYRMRIGWRSP